MNTFTKLFTLFALAAALAFGQGTSLTSTTLSAAITSASATQVTLASSTGVTAQGTSQQFNTVLYVGKELMGVKALVSGTTWSVQRGLQSTRPQTYWSGQTVLLGSPTGNFNASQSTAEPSGACTATAWVTLPQIFLPSGNAYNCLGGRWTLINALGRLTLGTTVASATTIAATGTIFHVSGTTAIVTITAPAGVAAGTTLYIIPDGVFTWTAAGNIALAGTAVVNKVLLMVWSGSAWVPSYIA